MKIAITGGTAGIGQALGNAYQTRGHEVVTLSRRTGYNIHAISKIVNEIDSCDVFINNAQAGYAQTELLFEMAQRWAGTKKHIIVISTMMTQFPTTSIGLTPYLIQKIALEQAVKQLRSHRLGVKLTIVRPGNIATSPEKTVPPSADVTHWAETLINIFEIAEPDLVIPDISLGPAW